MITLFYSEPHIHNIVNLPSKSKSPRFIGYCSLSEPQYGRHDDGIFYVISICKKKKMYKVIFKTIANYV